MSVSTENAAPSTPLKGVAVCMLRSSDYSIDGRARKQASALIAQGARVVMVGQGSSVDPDLAAAGFEVDLVPPFSSNPVLASGALLPLKKAVKSLLRWRYRASSPVIDVHGPRLAAFAEKYRPAIVHAYDTDTLPAALALKEKIGCKVVFDCLDLLTEVDYIDSEKRERIRAYEAQAIPQADAVLVVGDAMGDVLASRHEGVHPVAIYNGPSKVVDSASPASVPVKLFFQGSFSADRNIEALVRSMQHLRPHATLSLQGFGGIHDYLVELVDELDLGDVVEFVPACAPLEVVDCASRYDVGVVCHVGSDLNMDIAAPNKLMDYLGAGLAVAGSDLPGIRSVIGHTGAGVLIDPTDEHTIAASLLPLVTDPAAVSAMKARAVELARTYVWPVQAERLVEVYRSLLEGGDR